MVSVNGVEVVGPLDGIRVLDLTSVVMGPLATQVLGDLGADVITIESGRGDTNRGMGPGPMRQLSDVSLNLLRNKRNVALDLKAPAGLAALLRITATCDVFVTNLRPGPLNRLGLGYDQIAVYGDHGLTGHVRMSVEVWMSRPGCPQIGHPNAA